MPDGRIPGAETGAARAVDAANVPHAGFATQTPVAANTGSGSGPRLTGWPRTIGWGEFEDVDSRPAGQGEDAQIDSHAIQPQEVGVVRENGQLRLANYVVRVSVNTSNSWVVRDKKTDDLLAHEQGHYDITGLTARDMVADLAAIRVSSTDELQREVTRIIQATQTLGTSLTNQYDTDDPGGTDHGRRAERQQVWAAHLQSCREDGTRLTAGPA